MKVYNDRKAVFNHKGNNVEYSLRMARKDCNHLIVLFNGYRHSGWDFSRSIDFLKCHILFIEDNFQGQQSCYLGCNGNKYIFSDSVNALINSVLIELQLTKNECTLFGASKGGFAALFMALKYDYQNVIASSFVGNIGKWMIKYNDNIAKHVMGNYNDELSSSYDDLLLDLIDKDKMLNKNIYLFISEKDHFYLEYGQEEVIKKLVKYDNANLFLTNSALAFQHDQVAAYFLQEILSIAGLLIHGVKIELKKVDYREIYNIGLSIIPLDTEIEYFKKSYDEIIETSVNNLNKLFVSENKLHLEGDAYIHNFDSPTHAFLSKKLSLYDVNLKKGYEFPLGTLPSKHKTKELFSGKYVNYAAAGVATMGLNGIDLELLPDGEYLLMISVTKSVSLTDYKKVNYSGSIDQKVLIKNSEYRLYQKQGGVYLTKKDVIGHDITEAYIFELDEAPSIVDGRLFVQGKYAVIGSDMTEYNQGEYYFIMYNDKTGQQVTTLLGQMQVTNIADKFGSFSGYDTCAFATKNFEGIDLNNEDEGTYSLFVSLSYKSGIFRKKLPFKLEITRVGLLNSINSYLLIND